MLGLESSPTASPARLAVAAVGASFLHQKFGASIAAQVSGQLAAFIPGMVSGASEWGLDDALEFAVVGLELALVSKLYTMVQG